MIDEGYTKYSCDWRQESALSATAIHELNKWRNNLHDAGLLGYCEERGVGFGNVSIRTDRSEQFIISGTQTGHIRRTDEACYSLVTGFDIDKNYVACVGPIQASSEALTHAALYALDDEIRAIGHVHSSSLWRALLYQVPTSAEGVSYGSPDMAREFQRLYRVADLAEAGIVAMAGHEEGVVVFGDSIGQAAQRIRGLTTNL